MKNTKQLQIPPCSSGVSINFKFIKTLITMAFVICLFHFDSNAQVNPPLDSYTSFDGNSGMIYVMLPDSNITDLEVVVSSKGSNLFSHIYTYDQFVGLPQDLSYMRNGLNVVLGIGTISVPPAYSTKIRLKSGSAWSTWFEYTSN
jgi:hypothetical protein